MWRVIAVLLITALMVGIVWLLWRYAGGAGA